MRIRFDRGTLLVTATEREVRALEATDILWDARIGAWRAPAFRHRDLVARAAERGVRISEDHVRIPDVRVACLTPILRPYQEGALSAWMLEGSRGCVSLPTGSGETVVGVAAIARLRVPTLVLIPTRVLLQQWQQTLSGYGVEAGVYGDGSNEVRPVTVCTFESAYRHLDAFGDRFGLLVVDEVHHFGSGIRAEALEMTVAPHRLGLSATLPDAPEAQARLRTLVGPTVFELRIADLAGSHLAPLDRMLLPVDLDPEERARYAACYEPFARACRVYLRTCPDGTWVDFIRAMSRTEAGREAVRGWRQARALLALPRAKRALLADLLRRHARRRTLIFTADNAAAYEISRELLVPAITCEIERIERVAILEAFRRGERRAIVSSRVLNEGLDVPDAEVGIVLGGALGSREHAQRVGRILRPRPGKRAALYEVVVRDSLEWRQSRRRQSRLAPREAVAS